MLPSKTHLSLSSLFPESAVCTRGLWRLSTSDLQHDSHRKVHMTCLLYKYELIFGVFNRYMMLFKMITKIRCELTIRYGCNWQFTPVKHDLKLCPMFTTQKMYARYPRAVFWLRFSSSILCRGTNVCQNALRSYICILSIAGPPCIYLWWRACLTYVRPRHNDRHFANDVCICIF